GRRIAGGPAVDQGAAVRRDQGTHGYCVSSIIGVPRSVAGRRPLTVNSGGYWARRGAARDRGSFLSREDRPQVRLGVASEELAQVLVRLPAGLVLAQQALDRGGDLRRRAAIPDLPRHALELAQRTAQEEIVGVDHPAVHLHLLPFDADVRDPVLAAAIRAAGDVDLQVLVEAGEALVQLLHEPAGEALRLRDGEFAELRSGAGNG